jgi:hypothetical protein
MFKGINTNFLWYVGIILINIILPFLVFASFNQGCFDIYFSSDTLYLASIYKDIFDDGTGLTGWNLNGAPNFFPDMFLYFIIKPFFEDFKVAYMVFSVVQYNLILLLIGRLFKSINPKIPEIHAILFYVIFPIFLLATIWQMSFRYTYDLFSQSYHNGCFINVLAAFNLLFIFLRTGKKNYLYGLVFFAIMGAYNDRLFLVIFTVPLLLIWVLNFFRIKDQNLKKTGYWGIGASIFGFLVFNATSINGVFRCIGLGQKYMNIKNALPSLEVFLNQHWDFLRLMNLRSSVVVMLILSLVLLIIWLVKTLKTTKGLKQLGTINTNEFFFTIAILFSMAITTLTPIINGYYVGYACVRYIMLTHFIGIFNLIFAWYLFSRGKGKIIKIGFASAFLLFHFYTIGNFIANKSVIENLQKVAQYYPEKVQNLDNFLEKHNLQYGVATYWNAKLCTMLSKNDARVYTTTNSKLSIWYHVMNSNWYYVHDKGKYNNPKFNFVIMDTADMKISRKLFGEPIDSALYNGSDYIYYMPEIKFNKETQEAYRNIND